MSNKEVKTETRRKYRSMWPSTRKGRHKHKKGVSGSLNKGHVYLWDTGVVTAFNQDGVLIPDLCGLYNAVRHVVLKRLYTNTVFARCRSWQREPFESMTLDEFKCVEV
jgi:hypothetical protein